MQVQAQTELLMQMYAAVSDDSIGRSAKCNTWRRYLVIVQAGVVGAVTDYHLQVRVVLSGAGTGTAWTEVDKLLLKSSGVTLLLLLVKETSYL